MKYLILASTVFLMTACVASVQPISPADNDQTQTWIFVNKSNLGSDNLQPFGVYHCESKDGKPVCAKAQIKN